MPDLEERTHTRFLVGLSWIADGLPAFPVLALVVTLFVPFFTQTSIVKALPFVAGYVLLTGAAVVQAVIVHRIRADRAWTSSTSFRPALWLGVIGTAVAGVLLAAFLSAVMNVVAVNDNGADVQLRVLVVMTIIIVLLVVPALLWIARRHTR